ncbi:MULTISPECIES: hypothetical protein [unclassified Duganella]|uniref:hypothetical protein n=1 Tax=unclassified Duganella TaxID=2636909 RepID=UPI000E34E86A|nr:MULTISPECIES: hypothetical protein [unclassified Duganella]RFP19077.1 hypothetical protein D0T23_04645 [Duganella sp. BJB475]RFP35739.1 hypothetical protein D0T21_04645 [Duganella sp. BJB476]
MRPQFSLYVVLLAPLVLVGLYWSSSRPGGEPEAARQQAASRAALAETSRAKPPTQLPKPDPRYTLAQQVDQLASTGKPSDAYDAYWLVQNCINFQRTGDLVVEDGDAMRKATDAEKSAEKLRCADLTERMKTTRLEHLTVATKAGVFGANLSFLHTGPFGDPSALESRPDDPLVQAWKLEALGYLEVQAQLGDMPSMISLLGEYNEDSDLLKQHQVAALRYATAVHDDYEMAFGGSSSTAPNPLTDEFMQKMSQGLSPDQVKQATSEGKQLLARSMELHKRH